MDHCVTTGGMPTRAAGWIACAGTGLLVTDGDAATFHGTAKPRVIGEQPAMQSTSGPAVRPRGPLGARAG